MSKCNKNHVKILDLPNEILLIIFEKLNMIDVLYSIVDADQRFNQLIVDRLHMHDLKMIDAMTINSFYSHTYSIDPKVISRICKQVLFRIADKIHELTIEHYSMKQILGSCNYPELYSFTVVNCVEEILYQDLQNDLNLRNLLGKQITNVNIDIQVDIEPRSETVSKIFALLLSLCQNLRALNFCDIFLTRRYHASLFLDLRSENCASSSLVKLQISVSNFADCLYILDGRFDSLSTLIINVGQIFDPVIEIGSSKQLVNLKCFSFTCYRLTSNYDYLIVPLLRRMINLEELRLYLHVLKCSSTFIDGIQIYDQFLIYMTQLKKFTFSIYTTVSNEYVPIDLQSNEDIHRSFIGKGYGQVASYIRNDSLHTGDCHIHSVPYDFEYYIDLDNCFQGGIFEKVRYLTMYDQIPFKQQLLKLLPQYFPFVEHLYISNHCSLERKQHSSTSVTFSHLTTLDIQYAHIHYAEEFLLKNNTHLPRLLNLRMDYVSLEMITNNFTTNPTYFNFETWKSLDVCEPFVRPQHFHEYFPLL